MKLFENLLNKLEDLKAIRLVRTMVTLALVCFFALIFYVASLPISVGQKIIVLMLSSILSLLTMIADDHASKQAYLDELRNISEKLEDEDDK